jgi:hypothetical protein
MRLGAGGRAAALRGAAQKFSDAVARWRGADRRRGRITNNADLD